LDRVIKAFYNSVAAFRQLIVHEKAFQQEVAVLAAALPIGWLVAADARGYLILISAVLLVMIVEILNTAIEAICDLVSPEFNPLVKIAKDCGSLAVLLAIAIAAGVWGLALWERISD
jgi:diacylglycerol kinase (ATP)